MLTYARALAELESYRPAHVDAAIAANGGSLADRIARLLGQSRPVSRTHSGLGSHRERRSPGVAACGLFGQSDAAPQFEVASVKLNTAKAARHEGPRRVPVAG